MADILEATLPLREWQVPENQAGMRLDRALAHMCGDITRAQLQRLIDENCVWVDGQLPRRSAQRVLEGQTICLQVPEPTPDAPQPQDIPLSVLYEDAHLIVIDKAVGMAAHPAPGTRDGTVVNALLSRLHDLSGIGGVLRPGIVHRLDKDTTGVMIVAKDDRTHLSLCKQFAARAVQKHYMALVAGIPKAPEGILEGAIGRSTQDRKKMALCPPPHGREATTNYKVEQSFALTPAQPLASLVHFWPQTGRTHQIRVHATHLLRAPLLGDVVYGGGFDYRWAHYKSAAVQPLQSFARQALHAHALTIHHPVLDRAMTFTAPLPPDMAQCVAALAQYAV